MATATNIGIVRYFFIGGVVACVAAKPYGSAHTRRAANRENGRARIKTDGSGRERTDTIMAAEILLFE